MTPLRFRRSLAASILLSFLLGTACTPAAEGSGKAGADRGGAGGRPAEGRTGGGTGGPGGLNGGAPRKEVAVSVRAAPAVQGSLEALRDAAATVVPVLQSSVAAPTSGLVRVLLRQAGDWVEAGEAVIQLDDAQLRLSLATARASLESARINLSLAQDATSDAAPRLQLQLQSAEAALAAERRSYESQKAVVELGGSTAAQLEAAAGKLAQAEANVQGAKAALEQNRRSEGQDLQKLRLAVEQAANQLAQAELNLGNALVRAPFAGQIASIAVAPGMYLGQNGTAFVLVSRQRRASFSLPPAEASQLPPGAPVEFLAGSRSYGMRTSRNPSVPVGGVVPLLAEPQGAFDLPFGSVGTLRYSLALARGAIVPGASIVGTQAGASVFVVEEGRARRAPIRVLAEYGELAAVEGLAEGSLVVLDPPPGLIPGSLLESRIEASPAADLASGGPGAKAEAEGGTGGAPGNAPGKASGRAERLP